MNPWRFAQPIGHDRAYYGDSPEDRAPPEEDPEPEYPVVRSRYRARHRVHPIPSAPVPGPGAPSPDQQDGLTSFARPGDGDAGGNPPIAEDT